MAKHNKAHTVKMVKEFLSRTGFPFEMKMADILRIKGWDVVIGDSFLDLEENKKREIDIIAAKYVNDIKINLIVECKFSQIDSWIFVSPNKNIPRYRGYFKHSPFSYLEDKSCDRLMQNCMNHVKTFDKSEPTGINFICFNGDKQSNNSVIVDALHKVVKASINVFANTVSCEERSIYFTVILFSGPIFVVGYDGTVRTRKENYVQYPFEFESESYKCRKSKITTHRSNEFPFLPDFDETLRLEEIGMIKNAYREMWPKYMIECVSESKFRSYLDHVESGIGKIDIGLWPLKKEDETNTD